MIIECKTCGKKFFDYKSNLRKFCSAPCYIESIRGKTNHWKGKKKSTESVEKMRKTLTGRKLSKEHRKNIGLSRVGIPRSEETKQKLRGPRTKDGIVRVGKYVYIYSPNHPFKTNTNYVNRSRLVMEEWIGRYLTRKEVVHHINKITDDDKIENLMLFKDNIEHMKYHKELRNNC